MGERRRQIRARERKVEFGGYVLSVSDIHPMIHRSFGQYYRNTIDGKFYVSINSVWVPCESHKDAKKKMERALKIKKWRR